MNKHTESFGSMHDIRKAKGCASACVPRGENTPAWIAGQLAHVGYAQLSREDKGLVRSYLQSATGYSRAQIARYISAYNRQQSTATPVQPTPTTPDVSPVYKVRAQWMRWSAFTVLLLLTLSLRGQAAHTTGDVLRFIGGDRQEVMRAPTGAPEHMRSNGTYVVRAMLPSDGSTTLALPLLAVHEERTLSDDKIIRSTMIATDLPTLRNRVNARRQKRLSLAGYHRAAPAVLPLPSYNGKPLELQPQVWDALSSGKNGQILMIIDGKPEWRDFPYLEQIKSLPPHGNEMTRRAGGLRDGGGQHTEADASTTTTIIQQSSGGSSQAVFVGLTSDTSFDGSLSYSGKVGYEAANAICAAEYAGSHFCRTDEILNTIATQTISSLFTGVDAGWIAEGPPGYTSDSNDCSGWTTHANTELGPWWQYATSGGGQGFLTTCSSTKPLSCCR